MHNNYIRMLIIDTKNNILIAIIIIKGVEQ